VHKIREEKNLLDDASVRDDRGSRSHLFFNSRERARGERKQNPSACMQRAVLAEGDRLGDRTTLAACVREKRSFTSSSL
jgi:hypothetical protein